MSEEIGVVVTGVSGRMGQMLVSEIAKHPGMHLAGAVEREGHDWVGEDVGTAMGGAAMGVIVSDDPLECFARAQAVIDFTAPAATVAFAELAAQARAVHVIGTTGLSDDDLTTLCKSLGDWSRHLPQIRNWTVSKVADCKGDVRWTHCSEQEFENLDAIMGPYLNHPYHWAVIDRLFHRESHSQMVYEYNHTIRPISKSVLSDLS